MHSLNAGFKACNARLYFLIIISTCGYCDNIEYILISG